MAAIRPYNTAQVDGRPADGHGRANSMANIPSLAELQAVARSEIKLTHNASLDSLFREAIQSNRLVNSDSELRRPDRTYVEWLKAELYIKLVIQNSDTPFMSESRKNTFTQIQTMHTAQRIGVKEAENMINHAHSQARNAYKVVGGEQAGSRKAVYSSTDVQPNGSPQYDRRTVYSSTMPPATNGTFTASSTFSERPASSPQDDPLMQRFRGLRVGSGSTQTSSPLDVPHSLRPGKPNGPRGMSGPPTVDKELPNTPPKLSTELLLGTLPRPPAPIYTPVRGTQNPNETLPRSSSIMPYTDQNGNRVRERRPFTELPNADHIEAEELFSRMKDFKLLLIDVRHRYEFDEGHIHAKNIICVEPVSLRNPISLDQLKEDGMAVAPEDESSLLEKLPDYDLVVYYDQDTRSNAFLLGAPQQHVSPAMRYLHDALTDFNADVVLQRNPVFLKGGINAWIELVSVNALHTSNTGLPREAVQKKIQRKPARRSVSGAVRDIRAQRLRGLTPLTADEDRQWREQAKDLSSALPDLSDYQTNGDGDSVASQAEKETFVPITFARDVNQYFAQGPAADRQRQSMTSPSYPQSPYNPPPQRRVPVPLPPLPSNGIPPIPSRPAPIANRPSYGGVSDHRSGTQSAPPARPAGDALAQYQPSQRSVRLRKTGLLNFGATCYMNSVIQCLSATIPLSMFFVLDNEWQKQTVKNWKGSNGLLPSFYANLIRALWNSEAKTVRPSSLRGFCARLNAQWGDNKQQDAQEFLVFLVDTLHEDFNQQWQRQPLKELTWDEERYREAQAEYLVSKKEWQRSMHDRRSRIDDLFAGQWMSRVTCRVCKTTFTKHEVFSNINLNIPRTRDALTIMDCLKDFCKEDLLDEYNCKPCGRINKAIRKFSITRLPRILVMSFNRYGPGGAGEKISTPIHFPLSQLDMQPYMADTVPRPDDRRDPAVSPPFKYDCYGVVRHIGQTARQGHYKAVCKDPGGNMWREFDDDNVTDFDPNDRRSAEKYLNPSQAYIVFYERSIPR